MTQEQIARINELARLGRERPLTEAESEEQRVLRRRYIDEFKANVKSVLDHTYIQEPDGSKRPLRPRKP